MQVFLFIVFCYQLVCVYSYSQNARLSYKSSLIGSHRSSNYNRLNAYIELEPGKFDDAVIKASQKGYVLVDFMANWCGPCKLAAPIFKSLSEDFNNSVDFIKVDTDIHEDTVDQYNIQGLPLFALFHKGSIIASHSGALTKDNLKNFITKNVK